MVNQDPPGSNRSNGHRRDDGSRGGVGTVNRRSYTSGVEKALFTLSRGCCYEPICQQRVVRQVNGELVVNVHIAHICAHRPNGPRFDPRMSDEERRSFGNLILLCTVHHKLVDSKINEAKYPVEVLRRWKYTREGDFAAQLDGLDNLTEGKLQQIITDAIGDTKNEIASAINRLEDFSSSAARTLRTLSAEMFDRPYLDLDAVASLADSAYILRHLGEHSETLHDAAWKLTNLESDSTTLYAAARELSGLEGKTASLRAVVAQQEQVSENTRVSLDSVARQVSDVLGRMNMAQQSLSDAYPVNVMDHPQRWAYFRRGLAAGILLTVALVITIVVMLHHGH